MVTVRVVGLLSNPPKSKRSCSSSSLGTHLISEGQQWGYQVVTSSPKWSISTFPSSPPTNQIARLITYHPTSFHLPQGPREGWGREAASPNLKQCPGLHELETQDEKWGASTPDKKRGACIS